MQTRIKKITDDIYHLVIDKTDGCEFCGKNLLDFIQSNQVSKRSALILETRSKRCATLCGEKFLRACSHFDDIAYVVKEETATYNPWKHAMAIRNSNKNTHFFDSYQDALDWLSLHHQKSATKAPLDFTGNLQKRRL